MAIFQSNRVMQGQMVCWCTFNAELIVPKSTHQIIHTNRFSILRPFQRNVESALHISNESCHADTFHQPLLACTNCLYSSEVSDICKMNCSEFGQQKNLQRPDLKKAVAKHSAKLKAKNIFPLLPSTTYILDKSQSVSISKTDADIYTSKRGTERQPCEIRGKELEDVQCLTAFRMMETWHSFVDEQIKPIIFSNPFPKDDKEKQGVKEFFYLIATNIFSPLLFDIWCSG